MYLENVRNLCFHGFSWFLETSGMLPKLFYKNIPESLNIQNWGTILPRATWCVTNFWHHNTLAFQCNCKCKTCLAKYDLGNLRCEESSYTMTWYEEKKDLNRALSILRTNKNSLNNPLLGGTVHKIYMLCFLAAQARFCCESYQRWTSGTHNLARK